jgi:C4-dicarboxylate-binding protein DctP
MNRSAIAIVLVVALSVTILAGCGKPDSLAAGEDGAKVQGETYTVKIGHVDAAESPGHKAALEFKDYVEKESDGRIKVEIHPHGVLGGEVQLTEAVGMGTIEMAIPAVAVLTMYSNEFGVLDIPLLFETPEAGFNALDGELGERLTQHLRKVGIECLGYGFGGSHCITNNKRPILELADMKGLKIRVMESPVYIDMFKALGANPTPMSYAELFTAMQQKTVDGQGNPPSLIYTSKFYEVQKYMSLTNHVHSFLAMIINQDFLNNLPGDLKTLVKEAGRRFLVERQRELQLGEHDFFVQKLAETGMEINEISSENMVKFRQALEPMHEKYEKELGKDLFDLARRYNE